MRIPVLKVYVLIEKSLEEKLDDAKAEGIAEGKQFANKQIESLLHRNAKMSLALRNLAGSKKRK